MKGLQLVSTDCSATQRPILHYPGLWIGEESFFGSEAEHETQLKFYPITLELVSANSLATHQERQEKETTLELFLAEC